MYSSGGVAPIRQTTNRHNFSPGYGASALVGSAQRQRAGQHGSGARSDPMQVSSSRRRQRSNSADRAHARRGPIPAGPATANEWSDQIESLQHQIRTINGTLNNHSHLIAHLRANMDQAGNVHPSVIKRVEDLATLTDRRFVEGGEKVRQRLVVLQLEIRALAQSRGDAQRPPVPQPPGFAQHNISTPGSPGGRPTEEMPHRPPVNAFDGPNNPYMNV